MSQANTLSTPANHVVTVQQTSKRVKLHMLLSTITIFLGIGLMFTGTYDSGVGAGGLGPALGLVMIIVGLVWKVAARIMRWWHHE